MTVSRWKPVSVDTSDEADEFGEIDMNFVIESPDGVPFFVCVSGQGQAPGLHFVQALQAAAAMIAHAAGGEQPPGVRIAEPLVAGTDLVNLPGGPETKQ